MKNTTHTHLFYGHLDFVWDYLGKPVPELIWILLKQETVSGSGISWAICKSAPSLQTDNHASISLLSFTGRMPFLPPNQQHQAHKAHHEKYYPSVF